MNQLLEIQNINRDFQVKKIKVRNNISTIRETSQTQMREKAVCENTNLLEAHARVQTKRNEPTESRTLKLEPKNLKGRNRRKPEDIVFNNELTQQTNTQSQQVASAYS